MEKVFGILKKYVVISFILSIITVIWTIVSVVRSNTPPTIDFIYVIKVVCGLLMLTVIFVPGIAIMDLFCVQSLKLLYKDYKESDKKGRIILIVICICILLRKILIWTS